MTIFELPLRGAHHMGPGFGGFHLLQGLLLLLVAGIVALLVRGRIGPVRWVPRGPAGTGPRFGPGPAGQGPDSGGPVGWATGASRPPEDTAFETLRMRLANGDITPDEYLERTSVLRRPQPPTDERSN
ncbi:SHOCT domain-containing protein [Aestuariimicrobium ganziense]|uniref:hypothetical protein n=1 Tax=Aestuariimicrobium ganziense TaxID=2773677 RepID=UPI0019424C24|nr:hypothetical protein [Aestuariimicrobium ganziense]